MLERTAMMTCRHAAALAIASAILFAPVLGLAQVSPAPGIRVPPPAAGDSPKVGGAAQPDEKKVAEARSRYKAGLGLYDDGAFDAARVQFERAYELAPSYRILYNIGLVYRQLQEFVGALKAFQQYLAEGGREIADDRKAEVTKSIESLREIVGSVTIIANAKGAEIMVDDASVGISPLTTPVLMNPGRRKISAKLDGRFPDAKVITVAGKDQVKVALDLKELPKSTVVNLTDLKPVVAWAVTGAFAISAGVTGYLAVKSTSDLSSTVNTIDTTADAIHSARVKQQTFSVVADACTVGAIISGVVALYFTLKKPSSPSMEAPEKKSAAIRVVPGLGGSLLGGQF